MGKPTWSAILLLCCASGANNPPFTEEAAARGLLFRHFHGGTGKYYLPESLGSGVALIDYDRDGDLDVYFLQSEALDPARKGWRPATASPGNRLYRNLLRETGRLRFEDVTAQAKVPGRGCALGAAVGDIDNDGYDDLYITSATGGSLLYRNNGNGSFSIADAGPDDNRVSTGAAFFDYDRDGDLDLLVLSYVDFTVAGNKRCPDARGRLDYCLPALYHPLPAKLFRNEGNGRFTDVTQASGIGSAAGAGLGIAICDVNGDGWLDAYVTNDGTPNHLWINRQNGTFTEEGLTAAVAHDESGRTKAGMGVAAGDFDNDGDEDLITANLMGEMLSLFENDGHGEFRETAAARKLTLPSLPFTGFAANWLDFDHDGRLDLFVANGSVKILDALGEHPYPYGQRNQLFRNTRAGFEEVRMPALDLVEASRGAAFGDLDNDGDIDIVIANSNGPARLLLNQTTARSFTVRIESEGARVAVHRAGQPVLWRRSARTGSYLSANSPGVHFGVDGAAIERIRVEWPDGGTTERTGPFPGNSITITGAAARPLRRP
jgi:predicted nucleotidyltransferase